jgi:hypothetical protein
MKDAIIVALAVLLIAALYVMHSKDVKASEAMRSYGLAQDSLLALASDMEILDDSLNRVRRRALQTTDSLQTLSEAYGVEIRMRTAAEARLEAVSARGTSTVKVDTVLVGGEEPVEVLVATDTLDAPPVSAVATVRIPRGHDAQWDWDLRYQPIPLKVVVGCDNEAGAYVGLESPDLSFDLGTPRIDPTVCTPEVPTTRAWWDRMWIGAALAATATVFVMK